MSRDNALKSHYEQLAQRLDANPELDLRTTREIFDQFHTLATEPTDVTYENVDADGVPAILIKPIGASSDSVIVYSHGGGFVTGTASGHRQLAGHLAKLAGVHSIVVDYRLAPEHPFPAAIDDLLTVHGWLRDNDYDPERIVSSGDSAGANLAIGAALQAREKGLPLPSAIIAFSPWVDMEQNGETLTTNASLDAMVTRERCDGMTAMYVGDVSRKHPIVNPLYADLAGFPPMFLTAGSCETLLDNAQRLCEVAQNAGVEVALRIGEGQQHVYQYMVGRDAAADASVGEAASWVRSVLDGESVGM